MEFTLEGADPRFRYLKERFEADGHRLAPDSENIIAPPVERRGVAYYRDPIYVLENAALTAEGAVELLMRRTDCSLRGTNVLVTGYGRIGRRLAEILGALGAHVTVAARAPIDRTDARLRGYDAVDIKSIPGRYDAVLNTIPVPVLRGDFGGALCIDLASAPGGWSDRTPVLKAPGLPGQYAPKAAADILAEAVYRIMEVDIIE